MAKNNKSKATFKANDSFDGNIWKVIYTVLAIVSVFCIFYLLTIYITNKNSEEGNNNSNVETEEETTLSTENIIVGRSLSMSDDDYLVIYYDKSDDDISSTYSNLVSDYKGRNPENLTIYTVDMGSSFNKGYATVGESNKTPASASEMLINGPTLIKVSNKQVVEYIEGEEAITEYLK